MIKEDYVSFETAKLLKEKWFKSNDCHTAYDENGQFFWYGDYSNDRKSVVDAPTLQMAMKWLREVYGIFISICNGNHKADNRDTSTPDNVYCFFVITDARALYEEEKQCLKEFSSYEDACEAAIKYCLEKLI